MSQTRFNISEAAKLAGVNRKTIQRKANAGIITVKKDSNGAKYIDLSELLRVYPAMSQPLSQEVSQNVADTNVSEQKIDDLADKLVSALSKIDALTNEISELKAHVMRLEYKETSEYLSQNTDQTHALNESVDQDTKSETAPKDSLSMDDIPSFLDL